MDKLQTLKIALEWATKNLNSKEGSKISKPDEYDNAKLLYEKVKNKFDTECFYWINTNC